MRIKQLKTSKKITVAKLGSDTKLSTDIKVKTRTLLKKAERPKGMDHSESIQRLLRARGQLDAVIRMIEKKSYCMDIVQQLKASASALKAVEKQILRNHLKGCVRNAFIEAQESTNNKLINSKIEEIVDLWS